MPVLTTGVAEWVYKAGAEAGIGKAVAEGASNGQDNLLLSCLAKVIQTVSGCAR